MTTFRLIQILIIFLFCLRSFGQALPPVANFSTEDYQAENQNWGISQSIDKTIYIANNQGLLEYNGVSWEVYPSPNETIMRAIKVVGNKIYTGCYMEFGFWQKDEYGVLQYTSLSKQFKNDLKPDEEFWNILQINEYLIFQSLKSIYIYNTHDTSVNIIDSDTTLIKIFEHAQNVYFQKIGEGIFKIENGVEVLLYDDEVVRNDEVVAIGSRDEYLFVLTRSEGIYRANKNSLERIITPDDGLFSDINIYSALQLRDGNMALGTISNGLVILDTEWNVLYRIDEITGLQNNTVLSLFEDAEANLWLGLDNGISFINLESPYRVFKDNQGMVGSVYTAVFHENLMYLGTNQGLFYRKTDEAGEFKLVKGTKGQVWSLDLIGKDLFCSHHTGTFVITGNTAKKIANTSGTWKIGTLNDRTDLLLQGSYNGLYILEKKVDDWQLRNKIEGFDNSAKSFEVFDKDIFVNHEYKGVFKVEVDSEYAAVLKINHDTTLIGDNSGMTKYKGELLYSFRDGIYKYNRNTESFRKDSLLSQIYSTDEYVSGKLLVDEKEGYLWSFSKSSINYITEGTLASTPVIGRIPLSEDIRNGVIGYESVSPLQKDGHFLFGTGSGYITADINGLKLPDFQVEIGRVYQLHNEGNLLETAIVNPNAEGQFRNNENHLRFSFYTTQYRKLLKPAYQYRLKGLYDTWSEWSKTAVVVYENLPHGEYVFEVRAKVGDKTSTNIASYNFNILKPGFLSAMMLTIYILIALILGLLVHRSYRKFYLKKQRLLIEANQKEMDLIRITNEKEIVELKNTQLQENFRNKSNELAASTMSIIKKNELLSKVKEQLTTSEQNNTIKEIVRIIDRNLDQSDDWELFKEAFNNADRKFLKKLEKKHPNLSPNDIKLCAYLRLNLVSKEIAKLLNISPRSVEIKRYRLRKKLNLEHDENLANYILRL